MHSPIFISTDISSSPQVVLCWSCILAYGIVKFFQWSELLYSWEGIAFSAALLILIILVMQLLVHSSESTRSTPIQTSSEDPAKDRLLQKWDNISLLSCGYPKGIITTLIHIHSILCATKQFFQHQSVESVCLKQYSTSGTCIWFKCVGVLKLIVCIAMFPMLQLWLVEIENITSF